jgi:hypothetical protein
MEEFVFLGVTGPTAAAAAVSMGRIPHFAILGEVADSQIDR